MDPSVAIKMTISGRENEALRLHTSVATMIRNHPSTDRDSQLVALKSVTTLDCHLDFSSHYFSSQQYHGEIAGWVIKSTRGIL